MNIDAKQDSTISFAIDLIKKASVSPDDRGCQIIIAERLQKAGFQVEHVRIGDVDNLWAWHGSDGPTLCFAGHTDIVPPGPSEEWETDPFNPTILENELRGRGAADMKTALAAMVDAAASFIAENPNHHGTLAFLITSDEEGQAQDGTKAMMDWLAEKSISIDWCVIGEPSSSKKLGDTIKIGRRGSLSGMLKIHGVQGHVAYPHLTDNPIERFAPVLAELYAQKLDEGNKFFPPTRFQVVQIESGDGFPNVTPGELYTRFNFRYSTVWDHTRLKQHVQSILDSHHLDYSLEWHLSGEPFLTKDGELISTVESAIERITGIKPERSTGGGTSDGRFIAPRGIDVVEFGAINSTIHKPNESILIDDIGRMCSVYHEIMRNLLV
ncbi:MAG: succinyl-diaminopimelate desuccinylase [Pseudomonadota bacterium]|nr:succinyl-diaminopimelate desuccinylase [Pseudomonadota bacterium]